MIFLQARDGCRPDAGAYAKFTYCGGRRSFVSGWHSAIDGCITVLALEKRIVGQLGNEYRWVDGGGKTSRQRLVRSGDGVGECEDGSQAFDSIR